MGQYWDPEQAEDTSANETLAWLNTVDGEATIPAIPSSPRVTAFLQELPDGSAYMAEGSCPKEQAVVAGLGNSQDTVPDIFHFPNTTCLEDLPDLCMYVVDGDCPQDRAVVACLGDSEDPILTSSVPNLTTKVCQGCWGWSVGGSASTHHPQD